MFDEILFDVEPKCNQRAIQFRNEGNNSYKEGKYFDAIHSYNESLCDAIKDNEIALAYGNRSAVYFELKLYKICLENIELAIKHNYPKNKLARLLERKKKCQTLLGQFGDVAPNQNAKNFFKLSYPAHPKIPFVVDCVELKRDKVYGRGLYATKDMNPGDIIAIETPVVSTLIDAARYTHCCNCLKVNNFNLIPCQKSSSLMFCSQTCIDIVDNLLGDRNLHLMLRYMQLDYIEPDRYAFEFMKFGFSREECETMRRSKPDSTIFDCNVYAGKAKNCNKNLLRCLFSLKSLSDYENEEEVCEYYHGVMLKNGISLSFANQRGDGTTFQSHASVLCLFGSFFNHACEPNVRRVSLENKIVFYLEKPVRKGEQLFISYSATDLTDSHKKRRESVKQYEFTCECTACVKNLRVSKDYGKKFQCKKTELLSVDEAIEELRSNCEVIKTEFDSSLNLNEKLYFLMDRNWQLMYLISSVAMFPQNLS